MSLSTSPLSDPMALLVALGNGPEAVIKLLVEEIGRNADAQKRITDAVVGWLRGQDIAHITMWDPGDNPLCQDDGLEAAVFELAVRLCDQFNVPVLMELPPAGREIVTVQS